MRSKQRGIALTFKQGFFPCSALPARERRERKKALFEAGAAEASGAGAPDAEEVAKIILQMANKSA
jgi:hypothetical protein